MTTTKAGTNKTITPIIHLPSGTAGINEKDEESVSAIQSFINATSDKNAKIQLGDDLKVPKGVKITSAGKGVVNIRAVAESTISASGAGSTSNASPSIVAAGRGGMVTSRGRGSPISGRGRGSYTSTNAAAAASALPKAADTTPKGAVKTVTLTAGGIIKRVVPAGRVPGSSVITTPTNKASPTAPTASPKNKVNDVEEELDQDSLEELEKAIKEQEKDVKKDLKKTPTLNGSKVNSSTTPNSRGRCRGAKGLSSPTYPDKDNEGSDSSPVKEGPKIIRLKSNSAAEVLKSANASLVESPTTEESVGSKRKGAPVTPTANDTSNSESPSVTASGESRSKRARKEKKIFDL